LSIISGFTAGHTYAFSVDDFVIEEWNWGYGGKDELGLLEKEQKHVARERNEDVRREWGGKGRGWGDDDVKGKGKLGFKCVEGAIVETKWVKPWRGLQIFSKRNLKEKQEQL
jgi:hypothetical protein